MTDDRDYDFLMTMLDTASQARAGVAEWLRTTVRPAWEDLVDRGLLHNGRVFWRIRDYDMPEGGTEWTVVLLAEVEEGRDAADVAEEERAALAATGFDVAQDARVLGRTTVRRRAGSGTPVPRPGPCSGGLPPTWRVGVVLVDVPEEHHDAAVMPMREFHGPVSQQVVDDGDAYRILIGDVIERHEGVHPALPWSGVAIIDADWDNDGFADAVRRIVPQYTDDEALMKVVYEVDELRRSRQTSVSDELVELGVGVR